MKPLKTSTLKKYSNMHLIDISYILYRAYFAMPNLAYDGKKTGHFKGLCELLTKLHQMFNMESNKHCAIFVFDSTIKYRKKIFPQYKETAARAKTKESAPTMYIDYDNFKRLISIFPNMFSVQKDRYEADDIIVYLTKKFHSTHRIFVYSKDQDLFFLKRFKAIFKEGATTNINVKEVLLKKYRIDNYRLLPYIKILNGDKSDNIPAIFDLRKTKKFIAKWYEDKKITLYCKELQEEKKAIQRNIKLVMPIRVKDGVSYVDRDEYTDAMIFETILDHNLVSFMKFLKDNKKLINIGGLYGEKEKCI